ncbi:MAG: carbon-nitrogen hydrolase family protein [Candidatus Latescibacterota bacterium]
MRIGHCQMEVRPGDWEANVATVLRGLETADQRGVEIVSFPECCLNGYFDREEPTRRHAVSADGPQIREFLVQTSRYAPTVIAGLNERRGGDLYNTALVAQRGELLGTYSKAFAYQPFHRQGREFPVFERSGVRFGVVICADGGYIEPTRILALKGARIIFSPHYNYITQDHLINHFQHVRSDHVARAVENAVWFLRGNNVVCGRDEGMSYDGVGYGDSYLVDPFGEIVVRSRRHQEDFIEADVDVTVRSFQNQRSRQSAQALGAAMVEAAGRPEGAA